MKCKAYTNWTVAFIHAQSGTMGVNSTMYLITIHLITNVSAVTVNCDGVGVCVCVCSNREKSHTRFEMYFQMQRKLNWLMAKWMRLNGFRWAFLHTVKRLMMALVSFCKPIQCVNEIELVNKHRIYLSHHTTPHYTTPEIHLACLFRFCSRFCTRKLFETNASAIYNVWLLSMELNILANLRLNLIWYRSICRHYSRKFQSIFFNLILFRWNSYV